MTALDDTPSPRLSAAARPWNRALLGVALATWRLPWIDAPARALGLRPFTREHLTRQFLMHLRRSESGRSVYLHTPVGIFLLPLSTADAVSLIATAEGNGGCGPVTGLTRTGTRLTTVPHVPSRSVVKEGRPESVRPVVRKLVDQLLATRGADDTVAWPDWSATMRRLSRHLVLGADAADDTLLSGILDAVAGAGDPKAYESRTAALRRRVLPYLHTCGPEGPPVEEADAAGHMLDLVTRAVTHTAAHALAALADQQQAMPREGQARGAVRAAMLDHPPVFATVHRVCAPFTWDDRLVEAGTDVLHLTSWLRELDGGEDGSAGLCTSAAPCPAEDKAVLLAEEVVETVVRRGGGTVTVGPLAERARSAPGHAPAHHAGLAHSGATRLTECAEALAAFARDDGWNHDALGERCRMTLLAHAQRCSQAAADVRGTARWLAR